MTDSELLPGAKEPEPEEKKGIAIARRKDGLVVPTTAIPSSLWAYADTIPQEDSIAALPDDFHKMNLQRDREGLDWRPKMLKINHSSGTFDLSEMGVADYSPSEILCNILAHAPNRALWRLKQDSADKKPYCSSLDALTVSLKKPDGNRLSSSECTFGRWWNPIELLRLIREMPEKYERVGKYINARLRKDVTIESLAREDPPRNIPPPCKEVRRLFLFAADHLEKGVLNQPLILQVPPTSVQLWDKYRDGLNQYKVKTRERGLIPVTLITGATQITLEKETIDNTTFSRINFKYANRIFPADFVMWCEALRQDWSPRIMSMEIIRDDFDTAAAIDPTKLSDDEKARVAKMNEDLGETIEIADEDEDPFASSSLL